MAELFQEWDSTLNANPTAGVQVNRGCSDGYAAEFVAPGQPMAISYNPSNPNQAWIRCRYVANVTAADIVSETGTSAAETVGIFTGAVSDTLKQFKEGLPGLPTGFDFKLGLVALAIVGVAVLAVLYGPRR